MQYEASEIIAAYPVMVADIERLQRDMTSAAVDVYDGRLLDMAGMLDHLIEHLHDVREALGLERYALTVSDITGEAGGE